MIMNTIHARSNRTARRVLGTIMIAVIAVIAVVVCAILLNNYYFQPRQEKACESISRSAPMWSALIWLVSQINKQKQLRFSVDAAVSETNYKVFRK